MVSPSFLKVGWSVWEFKIDPKRLREEIKNDVEKRRKKINEKRPSRATKGGSKSFATVWPGNRVSAGRAVWSPEAPRSAPIRAVR